MPIGASSPQRAATTQPRNLTPTAGVDHGPFDAATLSMLRVCEARPGDVDLVLAPAFGLGAHAGQPPMGSRKLEATKGLSRHRTIWLMRVAAGFAQKVGPPAALIEALRVVDELGVIGAPPLSAAWRQLGLSETDLHPLAIEKIARMLYGLDGGLRIATGAKRRWRMQLVVARRLDRIALPAAAAIRPALRAGRMLTVRSAATLVPGLTTDEVRRLGEACWSLSSDRDVVVDWAPKGIDWGICRILAASGPVRAEVVHRALRRWVWDAPRRSYGWTPRTLDRYLSMSPLYEAGPGRTYALAGEWGDLTDSDHDILAALDAVGAPAPRPALVEALIGRGYSDTAAKHLIGVSPVVTPCGRGLYVRVGS